MKSKLHAKYRYSIILLKELVITDFKLRYQGSALGYLWSLLRPLFLFVILYVVFVYFLKIGKGVPHWPVAMLLGIVLFSGNITPRARERFPEKAAPGQARVMPERQVPFL